MMTFNAKNDKLGSGESMVNTHDASWLDRKVEDSVDRYAQPYRAAGRFFEIHVKGHLNSQWSEWLEGLEVKLLEDGEMILLGNIIDQAALMGILNKLNRLNLTLLSVSEVKKSNPN
jgi:hypothetical protein